MRYRWTLGVSCILGLGCGSPAPPQTPQAKPTPTARTKPAKAVDPLKLGQQHLDGSRYKEAEAAFQKALHDEPEAAEARFGLAQVLFITGRYQEAANAGSTLMGTALAEEGTLLKARALRKLGRVEQALQTVKPLLKEDAYAAQLLKGELLIELGRRGDAEEPLMLLIAAYNEDKITAKDGLELSLVARAAQLLRSPEDANDAFNQAEQVLVGHVPTLLWRAELFLDNYDPGHAEEVLSEVLKGAPNHPDALTLMAQVKLAQALDFDEAKRLIAKAHQSNPVHAQSYFVLGGIALRDMQLDEARGDIEKGLQTNPRDLKLLSLAAATEFLGENPTGYEKRKAEVFGYNRQYSEFYQVVGEYAEWEHRYKKIVEMMREAIAIDDDDAKAQATLGLNLIRDGQDQAGLRALRRAYAKDPFNVRVFNTLNLYEKVIPKDYATVSGDRFWFRYPKVEEKLLSRYVPELLNEAWEKMVQYYSFTPSTPVGIELYYQREHFAIRTSGLPHTAIQGVCFGKTLASMTPLTEDFNQAMTLWHELAHVFHIQLSNNRVPRWFTEGLAEYETLVQRKEWRRERDAELYDALRNKRLPKIGAMNEAFTHAEDMLDVTVAYYASTQIVNMLAEKYGRAKLREMLVLWGKGKTTPQVVEQALGATTGDLDQQFRAYLQTRLARFQSQFMPVQRVGNPDRVQERAAKEKDNPDAQARLALLAMRSGDNDTAAAALKAALKLDPNHGDALWLSGRLALRLAKPKAALDAANKLLKAGKDGYETQLMLAKATNPEKHADQVKAALERAHSYDPEQTDAIYGLLHLAQEQKDVAAEKQWLAKLVDLEEHSADSAVELMRQYSKENAWQAAADLGTTAIYAGMEDIATHLEYGKALAQLKQPKRAEYELVSATLAHGTPKLKLEAYQSLADFYDSVGWGAKAHQVRLKAKSLLKPEPGPKPEAPQSPHKPQSPHRPQSGLKPESVPDPQPSP